MPKIDIWMPWYIADYQADTGHLTPPQDSAYRKLLEHQWRTRKPLPNDVLALIQITKMSPFFVDASSIPQACLEQAASIGRASASKAERELYAWILDLLQQFFHQHKNGTWSQLRLEKELKIWGHRSEVYAERGKKGAAARWADKHAAEAAAAEKRGDASSIPKQQNKTNHADASSIARGVLKQSPSSSPVVLKKQLPTQSSIASLRRGGESVSKLGRSAQGKSEKQPPSPSSEPRPANASKPQNPRPPQNAPRSPRTVPWVDEDALPSSGGGKVPSKFAAPHTRNGDNPSKPRTETDPRFAPFRDEIFRAYEIMYGAGLVKTKRPTWGRREWSQLSALLSSNPDLDFHLFRDALVNWSRSDVNLSAPPCVWLPKLMSFSMEDLDRFGHPRRKRRVF